MQIPYIYLHRNISFSVDILLIKALLKRLLVYCPDISLSLEYFKPSHICHSDRISLILRTFALLSNIVFPMHPSAICNYYNLFNILLVTK